jgi:hypothetical protein
MLATLPIRILAVLSAEPIGIGMTSDGARIRWVLSAEPAPPLPFAYDNRGREIDLARIGRGWRRF